jgi:PAS domain S-box-containing protein
MRLVLDGGEPIVNQELVIEQPDGTRVDVLVNVNPLRDAAGRVVGAISALTDVSERRRAEATVRESGQRESAIFAQAGVGLAEVAFHGGSLHHVNDELCRMLGCTVAQAVAGGLAAIAHPEDLPALTAAVARLRESDRPVALDVRLRRADGGATWVNCRLTRVADGVPADRSPRGVLMVVVDVTERKRAADRDRLLIDLDDAIRRATEPRDIAMAACTGLAAHLGVDRVAFGDVLSDEGALVVIAEHNPNFPGLPDRFRLSDLDPYMRERLLANRTVRQADVAASDRPPASVARLAAMQIRALLDVPIVKDSHVVALIGVGHATPRAWSDADVEVVQLVANRCRDAIERVRAEQALRESQERLRMAVASAHMGFWDWDRTGGTVTWEPIHNEMMGLPLDQRVGTPDEFMARVHPDDRARVTASLDDAATGRGDYEAEFRAVHPDGTVRWIAGHGRGYGGGRSGPVTRVIGAVLDITERKRSEVERTDLFDREQAARAEAEAASRLKDEFLATLSHELRTPLSAILLWSKLLKGGPSDPEQLAEGLSAITTSAEAQKELIDDLLDTSRITSGKLRLQLREVHLVTLINEAVEAVQPAAQAREVLVSTKIESSGGAVLADPDRLRQVMWNLLTNAVKFTPKGGTVVTTLAQGAGGVTVSVADTGQGIPTDFLPHVFERFRQADASSTRRFGGMGLGLAITKQLVELHGGTITATSPGPGAGSTFTVHLPLPPVRAKRAAPKAAAAKAAGGAKPVTALHEAAILLVEDDAQTRHAIATTLRRAGATVTAVDSAADALAAFDRSRPDLLVSDIGLPSMNGYELMREIRAREAKAGAAAPVPAVALTAFVRPDDERKAMDAGFGQHLGKPVDPEHLLAVLAKMIDVD